MMCGRYQLEIDMDDILNFIDILGEVREKYRDDELKEMVQEKRDFTRIGMDILQQWKDAGLFMYEKSILMSTYILCGYANISSIGILLGGLGVLAPEKRGLISRIGVPAMIGGALVSVLSATIIGMILG